jgi:hypothetical protein
MTAEGPRRFLAGNLFPTKGLAVDKAGSRRYAEPVFEP